LVILEVLKTTDPRNRIVKREAVEAGLELNENVMGRPKSPLQKSVFSARYIRDEGKDLP
jgi:hypothetical protein